MRGMIGGPRQNNAWYGDLECPVCPVAHNTGMKFASVKGAHDMIIVFCHYSL